MLARPETTAALRPERLRGYHGLLTNTDRWDSFKARADDIFVCTPPKSGTTWTQAICAFLILGTNELYGRLADISPWLDSELESLDACLETLGAQNHRRFIKSHTPLDGIPFFEQSTYLVVYRHPVDVFFSWRNQGMNMIKQPDIPQLDPDPKVGFAAWVDEPFTPGYGESRTLEAYVYHYYSFHAYRHLAQFSFYHFSDMKRDLGAVVQRIAGTLGIAVTDQRVTEICQLVSFSSMKNKASTFSPGAGKSVLKSDGDFFRSGSNNQGAEILSPPDLQRYESKMAQLLSPAEIGWLENGGDLP